MILSKSGHNVNAQSSTM